MPWPSGTPWYVAVHCSVLQCDAVWCSVCCIMTTWSRIWPYPQEHFESCHTRERVMSHVQVMSRTGPCGDTLHAHESCNQSWQTNRWLISCMWTRHGTCMIDGRDLWFAHDTQHYSRLQCVAVRCGAVCCSTHDRCRDSWHRHDTMQRITVAVCCHTECCSVLQYFDTWQRRMCQSADTLQHTATHCNTLQHTATHCNTLQHGVLQNSWHMAERHLSMCRVRHDKNSAQTWHTRHTHTWPRPMEHDASSTPTAESERATCIYSNANSCIYKCMHLRKEAYIYEDIYIYMYMWMYTYIYTGLEMRYMCK